MKPTLVSVLTPTYNRRIFLPSLLECYMSQDYSKESMEWIILDDGTDCVKDVFDQLSFNTKNKNNIRYIRLDTKHTIGAKRNILNKEAKGDILICMDDDDFYPSDRVSHVVKSFQRNPTIDLAGSSEMYMYYTDNKKIYKLGPYSKNHATNGTMAWRSRYSLTHSYDETVTHAEESSFLEKYKNPMIQLDPFKVMLVISHNYNTFDKKSMRDSLELTSMNLKTFVKSSVLRKFYSSLAD